MNKTIRSSWSALASLIAGLAMLPCLAAAESAADYPTRPVHLIVGYTPGGSTDVISRLVAQRLSDKLGQAVIVENRAGAGSNIASEYVARSKADGYTLLVLTIQNATNMSIYKDLRYDTARDFAPIAQFMASPSVFVISPSVKADSLGAFITIAKANPNKYSYASTGVGGSPHLAGEMLKTRAGIELLHVPYKGTSPALIDVTTGVVSSGFMTTLGVLNQMQTGQVKPLAVAYSSRLPELPDVPTMAEAGLPNFEVVSWTGVAAPKGTPPEIVNRLNAAINDILNSPDMQRRVKELGGAVVPRTPAEFQSYVSDEIAKWRTVVRASKIELE